MSPMDMRMCTHHVKLTFLALGAMISPGDACTPMHAHLALPRAQRLAKPELYIFVWKHAILKTLSRISWLLTEEILQVKTHSRILTSWLTPFPPISMLV